MRQIQYILLRDIGKEVVCYYSSSFFPSLDLILKEGVAPSADCFISVKEITEHQPKGEGDRWYWDALYEDGYMRRIFNEVYRVQYSKEEY